MLIFQKFCSTLNQVFCTARRRNKKEYNMSFSEKYVNAVFSVATGSRARRNLLTPFGVLFFSAFVIGYILLSLFIDSVFGFQKFPKEPVNYIAGIPVFAVGLALAATCIVYFIINRGTPLPLNPPPVLIERGPYAYSRNPMVTGLIIMFFGLGIYFGSISLMFIFAPAMAILNFLELKHIEEPELVKRLGNSYEEYRKRVPMFIPRFKRKDK